MSYFITNRTFCQYFTEHRHILFLGQRGHPGRDGVGVSSGAAGPPGPNGKQGERGFDGRPGLTGDRGPLGIKGHSSQISVVEK